MVGLDINYDKPNKANLYFKWKKNINNKISKKNFRINK